jgi:hypothetical protein
LPPRVELQRVLGPVQPGTGGGRSTLPNVLSRSAPSSTPVRAPGGQVRLHVCEFESVLRDRARSQGFLPPSWPGWDWSKLPPSGSVLFDQWLGQDGSEPRPGGLDPSASSHRAPRRGAISVGASASDRLRRLPPGLGGWVFGAHHGRSAGWARRLDPSDGTTASSGERLRSCSSTPSRCRAKRSGIPENRGTPRPCGHTSPHRGPAPTLYP